MIDRLAAALIGAEVAVDGRDLADVLWLALLPRETAPLAPPVRPATGGPEATAAVGGPAPASEPAPADRPGPTATSPVVPAPAPGLARPGRAAVAPGGIGLSAAAPAGYTLPGRLAVGRALRPLKRRRRSTRSQVFDADATVDRFCDTGVVAPVLVPAQEAWFDVAVVADTGPTMIVWQDTVAAFADLLERHGAFRHVSRWTLAERDGRLRVLSRSGIAYEPRNLVDAGGHRLILVVTDCVGPRWSSDAVWSALREWGRSGPAAIVQTMPPRLWAATAMGEADVGLSAQRPGRPNRRLTAVLPWWEAPDADAGTPIPVVTLDPERLAPWARMVMGAGSVTVPGVAGGARPPEPVGAVELSAAERVEIFRVTVSPEAVRLALWLSAVEVSLPVARILNARLTPEPRTEYLAEVLAGGLLRTIAGESGFDFLPGVRELLQRSLRFSDVLEVWQLVTPYLEASGQRPEFSLLLGAAQDTASTQERSALQRITADLVRRLGLSGAAPATGGQGAAVPEAAAVPERLVLRFAGAITPEGGTRTTIGLGEPSVPDSPMLAMPDRWTEPILDPVRAVPLPPRAMRTAGRALYDAVARRSPVSDAFARALLVPPSGRCPVLVDIDRSADDVDQLPWEALCAPDGTFLGLDERWPIGRIVRAPDAPPVAHDLTPPVRIAAVLSALGVPAEPEWHALWDSVTATSGLPVELLVMVSEDGLVDAIAATVPPPGVRVTVEQVPRSTSELRSRVVGFDPHLLHFFCLGSSEPKDPYLQVAVVGDWQTPNPGPGLYLDADVLGELALPWRPWLVVLSCPESAEINLPGSIPALARRLVADGVPAVVGSRSALAAGDAATVTRALYRRLLAELSSRLDGTTPAAEPMDWGRLLVSVRAALCDRQAMTRSEAAASTLEWTLPVVHCRPEPFTFRLPTATAATAGTAGPPEPPGEAVLLDAFAGAGTVTGSLVAAPERWQLQALDLGPSSPHLPSSPPPLDWRDPRVGWAVVLPERPELGSRALARADDAGEPIAALVASRPGAKVLRYRGSGSRLELRDPAAEVSLVPELAPVGTERGALPAYLVLVGGPAEIPWSVQQRLSLVRQVGRLDLDPDSLARYVSALMSDWSGSGSRYAAPVTWAAGDIPLLHDPVTALAVGFRQDVDMPDATHLSGSAATGPALVDALHANRPALVATSSLGMIPAGQQLGLPVGQEQVPLTPDLLGSWEPDGAIWFAQACCSAGSTGQNVYSGLLAGAAAAVLDELARLGPVTAPLPRMLLGARRPLRAFVGRVGPTLLPITRTGSAGQSATASLLAALHDRLCRGQPVGLALRPVYDPVVSLLTAHARSVQAVAAGSGGEPVGAALRSRLQALDRVDTVVLGDPTVALPVPVL